MHNVVSFLKSYKIFESEFLCDLWHSLECAVVKLFLYCFLVSSFQVKDFTISVFRPKEHLSSIILLSLSLPVMDESLIFGLKYKLDYIPSNDWVIEVS